MTARDGRGWFTREPIRHGSYAGYAQHRRRGEPPCDACRAARNAWKRQRYRPRPRGGLAASRAADLRELGKLSGTVQQAAWAAGISERTIQRYRRLLREAA